MPPYTIFCVLKLLYCMYTSLISTENYILSLDNRSPYNLKLPNFKCVYLDCNFTFDLTKCLPRLVLQKFNSKYVNRPVSKDFSSK